MTVALALRRTLTDLIAVYQSEMARVKAAYAELEAAQVNMRAAISTYVSTYDSYGRGKPDAILAEITRYAWRTIFDHMELRKLASTQRWETISQQVEQDQMPELNLENVLTLLQAYSQNMTEILREAYLEAWDTLTPGKHTYGQRYKTNPHAEIGKTVILSGHVEGIFSTAHPFRINHWRRSDLIQVDRAFHALDGQTVMEGYTSPLCDAIESSPNGCGETAYFAFKAHHNGNLHLRFKRPELVAQLNALAGDGYSLKSGNGRHS